MFKTFGGEDRGMRTDHSSSAPTPRDSPSVRATGQDG